MCLCVCVCVCGVPSDRDVCVWTRTSLNDSRATCDNIRDDRTQPSDVLLSLDFDINNAVLHATYTVGEGGRRVRSSGYYHAMTVVQRGLVDTHQVHVVPVDTLSGHTGRDWTLLRLMHS